MFSDRSGFRCGYLCELYLDPHRCHTNFRHARKILIVDMICFWVNLLLLFLNIFFERLPRTVHFVLCSDQHMSQTYRQTDRQTDVHKYTTTDCWQRIAVFIVQHWSRAVKIQTSAGMSRNIDFYGVPFSSSSVCSFPTCYHFHLFLNTSAVTLIKLNNN